MLYRSLSKVAVSWELALLGLILAIPGSALGQVQDPFTGATPAFDAAPEEGTNYNSGDWGVSDQNGAVTYSVPIDVPPGRNGMAPSLTLRYSSNLPLRGGLAVGWTFDMPSIEVDLTLGTAEGVQYKIDLGGVSGRLIEVRDASPYPQSTSYRVQFDNSNTRIFFIDGSHPGNRTAGWIALTPDGVRHYFERVPGAHSKGVWNITRQVDSFGNTVLYKWSALRRNERVLGQSLVSIEYSGNPEAGINPHAKIVFDYAPLEFCEGADIPIGAAYRRGSTQVTGSQSLNAIKVHVRDTPTSAWKLRKQVDLSYKNRNSVLYEYVKVIDDPTVPPGDNDDPRPEAPENEGVAPSTAPPNNGDPRPAASGNAGVAPSTAPPNNGAPRPAASGNAGVAPSTAPQNNDDPRPEAPENEGVAPSGGTPWRTVPCNQNPLRYLTQIDVKAFDINGNATALPPIRFYYNDRLNVSPSIPQFGENPMREVTVNVPGFGQEGINAPHLGGLQATLLDIDNDGIRDRVSVIEEDRVCTLVWNKGLRGGAFEELERKSPLPTAAWYDEWRGNPEVVLKGKEGCNLSGQVAYRSVTNFQGDGTPGAHVLAPGHLSYHFMDFTGDGRLDLITTVWATSPCFGSYDPRLTQSPANPECNFGLDLDAQGVSTEPLKAEKQGDRFLWRVYPGTGDPQQPFRNQLPIPVLSPVNLPPPAASEAALDLSTTIHYSVPTLFDIDGDGFLDAIDTKPTTLGPCPDNLLLQNGCHWKVYFGNGTGTFPETDDAHIWNVPKATLDSDYWEKKNCDADFFLRRSTVVGLRDINGDGLADLVVRLSDGNLYSYRNTGREFDSLPHPLNGNTALEQVQTDCDGFVLGGSLRNGDRGYQRRLLDLDADGLLDMVWFEGGSSITETNSVKAKFNLGGRFGKSVTLSYPEKWALSKRLFAAEWESDEFVGNWHIVNDFTDVNGDGLADLVQWHPAGGGSVSPRMSYVSSPGLPPAPDLLHRVTNGRGMVLSFFYTPSTNRDVVDWGGSGSTLPTPKWVVSKSIVEGGFGTPATTTQYEYKQPNYHSAEVYSNFKERSQFAGFSQNIQTTNYSNGTSNQVRKLYDYKGLHADLASIKTYRDGQLHRVVRKEWLHESLFENRINQALPVLTATCTMSDATMGETECFSQADRVHRTEKEWQFSGAVRQFLNTQVREGFGIAAQPSDRCTDLLYANLYGTAADPEDYRIRVSEKNGSIGDASGNLVATGRTVMQYDTETGLVAQVSTFRDAQTSGTTKYNYDPETGNVLSIQKPLQNAVLGAKTTFSYDSHKLFAEETTNELGQLTKTTFDVATGVLRKREGPNFVSVAATPVFDIERWQLDGFGRVLSRSISIDAEINGSPTYEERIVERFTYNDLNFFDSGAPVSLRSELLLDFDDTHFIPVEQEFDGRGRVLTTRQLFEGDMLTLTEYKYADAGGVQTVETVDPRDNSYRITFTYRHDGLGRVTDFTRPDGTGTSIAYAGLDQIVSEVAPDGSGSSKTKKFDAFGRLIELQEHEPGAAAAVTRYEYDANDNLSQITDAEGNVTQMSHNWLGNRVAVVRGTRNWQYRYDLNGNLISKQSPIPLGADPAHYRTTFTYDALDRMLTQRFVDMRLSSPPASSSFTNTIAEAGFTPAMETIRYHYDQAPNSIGRLRQVELPFGQIDYSYDVRGLVTREERSLTLDGPTALNTTQQVDRSYNALGQLTRSQWHDGQQWRINYDERGLVGTVDWFDPQESAWLSVADYDREMTGLPEMRRTDFGQTRIYTYDALSRPLTDVLTLDGQPTALAERSYAYTDAGDLAAVVGHTNGVSANAVYGYDAHHRLLSADGPNEYRGRFTYSPTGNVRSADVTWADASQARNVNYTYGQVDPQAVDELVDAASGDTFGAFLYDDVGNMTWRSTAEGDQLLHWDGRDQIRSVDTGEGLETYAYDHMGQRALAVDAAGGVRFWFAERETHFGQDGSDSLNYLHLSGGGPTLARVENGSTIELQYADALQNLMFSLDRVGNVKSSFLYGPFGEVVFETGGDEHRRQFNGKESDVATGLRYYGFRYYDPVTLRWNSADPLYNFLPDLGLNEPQRMNLYAFSMNNPVRYYDPDGRAPKDDEDDGDAPEPVDCESGDCGDDDTEPEDDKPSQEDRNKELMRQIRERINACQDRQCVTAVIASVATQFSKETGAYNDNQLFEAIARTFSREIFLKDSQLAIQSGARGQAKIGVPEPGAFQQSPTMSATTRSDIIAFSGAAFGALLIVTKASTPIGVTILIVDLGVNLLNNHGYFD
jgi:RHS repeat-associated protein